MAGVDGSVVIQAILDTASISKNVRSLNKELEGVSWKNIAEGDSKAQALSGAFKSAGTACTMSLTAPIVAAGAAAFGVAANYEQATSRIQAALGLPRQAAEEFSEVGKSIYEDGWGQSLDEVNDALILTGQTLKGSYSSVDEYNGAVEQVSKTALMLSSVFGADVNETIRGTNALMSGFGLSAEEATDLMTVGMQRGLNYTDELGDNLSEYSGRWGEAGMSASEYFSILEAGTAAGSYNLDKVGDFLNEFLTSLADGRMEASIGSFSQSTQELWKSYKDGGTSAEDMLNGVIGEMAGMENAQQRATIASTLWSSLGEDNAMGMILSLGGVEDTYGDVAGAAKEAGDAASDSFANKSQEAIRTLQGSLEPLGEPLLNIAESLAGIIQGFGEWLGSIPPEAQQMVIILAAFLASIGPILSLLGNLIPVIGAVGPVLMGTGESAGLLAAAFGALTGPVGLAIGIIAAVIAAVMYLWNTNDQFRDSVTSAGQMVLDSMSQAWAVLQPILAAIGSILVSVLVPAAQMVADVIGSVFAGAFQAAAAIVSGAFQVIVGIAEFAIGYIQTIVGIFVGIFTGDWSMAADGANLAMQGCADAVMGILDGLAGGVAGILNAIVGFFGSILQGVVSIAGGLFGSVADAIRGQMGSAGDAVADGLSDIAGFFANLHIEWPHIPIPHFSLSGDFNLDPANFHIPSIGIDWYATGGVFNGPSIIGVGEAGTEAAVPLTGQRMQPFAEAIASNMAGTASAQDMAEMLALLRAILEAVRSGHVLMVDDRVLARFVREAVNG
jgi:phage-related minor tail protein